MEGLDKLLAMPYGCGEQNMLRFAPNIYIMDYLTATNQVSPDVERSAIEFMRSGIFQIKTFLNIIKLIKKKRMISLLAHKYITKNKKWSFVFVI